MSPLPYVCFRLLFSFTICTSRITPYNRRLSRLGNRTLLLSLLLFINFFFYRHSLSLPHRVSSAHDTWYFSIVIYLSLIFSPPLSIEGLSAVFLPLLISISWSAYSLSSSPLSQFLRCFPSSCTPVTPAPHRLSRLCLLLCLLLLLQYLHSVTLGAAALTNIHQGSGHRPGNENEYLTNREVSLAKS